MARKKNLIVERGRWLKLVNAGPFDLSTALLLTDGTVICQEDSGYQWARLTPDPMGSYVNGTWSTIPQMIHSRHYYASAVLADGRLIIAGGEESDAGPDLNAAEIWDPAAPTAGWQPVFAPPGWAKIGDAPCCVLADGRFLLGSIDTTATAIYDPSSGKWIPGGMKDDISSEETWTLLPDGSILCPQCTNHPHSERYDPIANQWVLAPDIPAAHDLVEEGSKDIGPAILLPNGNVIALGATGKTAMYIPPGGGTVGTWLPAPDLPKDPTGATMVAYDSPACLMPNGRVLCAIGPTPSQNDQSPIHTAFCEFTGKSFVRVNDPIPFEESESLSDARLLLLPSGEVLLTNSTTDAFIYQPVGDPLARWRPTIIVYPRYITRGQTYAVSGTQLNGLSQACSYGDDASNATNYPLIRIRHLASGVIAYCKTFDHTSMGVARGSTIQWTKFIPPQGILTGLSELDLIANGIGLKTPVSVTVY